MTETWSQERGRWKLHVVHVDAVKTAPPVLALTTGQMDQLVGTYRRGVAILQITRAGDHLMSLRAGSGDIALKAETRDVLFDPEQLRGRYVFSAMHSAT